MGLSLVIATGVVHGQQVDHYSPDGLREQVKPLVMKATAGSGSASETLQKYGVDYTMLAFRSKDGVGEVHEKFADIFIVIEGKATLLTGGELRIRRHRARGNCMELRFCIQLRRRCWKREISCIFPRILPTRCWFRKMAPLLISW